MQVIITSPSLDVSKNVSGISAVTRFIIENCTEVDWVHFEIGKRDRERGGFSRIFALKKCLADWKKLLRQHPEAIIHYNFPLQSLAILRDAAFLRAARNRKVVVHLHGGDYWQMKCGKRFFTWFLKRTFKQTYQYLTLSEEEQKMMQKTFHLNHVTALPNCPDLQDAEHFERTFNASKPLTIGYLGRIVHDKGMGELLEACKKMQEQQIPFQLKMAGIEDTPYYLPLFRKHLKEHFSYEGVVNGKQKSLFLQSIDVFALPSYYEGLPMCLLEAMSFGAVPITTNVGSIESVVTDTENGLYIAVKNSDSIAATFRQLNADREMLKTLSAAARETILQRFDPLQYVKKLLKLYQNENSK